MTRLLLCILFGHRPRSQRFQAIRVSHVECRRCGRIVPAYPELLR